MLTNKQTNGTNKGLLPRAVGLPMTSGVTNCETPCTYLPCSAINHRTSSTGRPLYTSVVPYNVLCICVWRHEIRNNDDVSGVVVGSNKTARLSDRFSQIPRGRQYRHHVMRVASWLPCWLAGVVNTVGMWLRTCTVCGWLSVRVTMFSGLLFSDKNFKKTYLST